LAAVTSAGGGHSPVGRHELAIAAQALELPLPRRPNRGKAWLVLSDIMTQALAKPRFRPETLPVDEVASADGGKRPPRGIKDSGTLRRLLYD
jgi:hypothetical protein